MSPHEGRSAAGGPASARTAGPDGTLVHPIKYRGDIDGLRAIAVLSVILFHMAPVRFPAGGIGVDVFFVISGYLIGGIILASQAENRFSFREFYLRRVRRIFPAFIVMILATALPALLFFYPKQLVATAWSAITAILCGSNFYFYATTDYFGEDHITLPYLHTWTLGVEEQFYFLFPLVTLLFGKAIPRRWLMPALIALLVASLALSEYQVHRASAAAFYLLPGRAWEMMIGVLAARVPAGWFGALRAERAARAVAAAIGLALIAISLAVLEPRYGFPGWKGLAPCLGAALVLVSGQGRGSPVHGLLALWPMRMVGLASYSLYLWHWPVIVLVLAYQVDGGLTPATALVVAGLTFVLGFGSWRWVEAPFRSKTMGTARLLKTCAALAAIGLVAQAAVIAGKGFPQRIPPRALELAQADTTKRGFSVPAAKCFIPGTDPARNYDAKRCLTPAAGKANWLLVGDSHAAMLYGGLRAVFPDVNLLSAAVYSCEMRVDGVSDGSACGDVMRRVFVDYLPNAHIDAVILASRWGTADSAAMARLAAMLRARGIRMVVVGPTPEFKVSVGRILAETERRQNPDLSAHLLRAELWQKDAALRTLADHAGFEYLSAMEAMCTGRRCVLENARGRPIYFDSGHYTDEGARILLTRMMASQRNRASALRPFARIGAANP